MPPPSSLRTSSALVIRRFLSFSNARPSPAFSACSISASSVAPSPISKRKKNTLVFMGSPQVSALVLDKLLDASEASSSDFEVAAIVTQPPARRERGRKVMPSHVAQRALDRGFPSELIFMPERAGEEAFLSNLKALNPGVCVTAAYGNILPSKFLEIPFHGTVNIHPSLLPLYRGAAPVQRALQDGVQETGVSLVYTVRALDAGPIIARECFAVDEYVKAPDLLAMLFDRGCDLLIREIPSIFDGSAKLKAQAQDDSRATLAPKLKAEESWLSFDQEAFVLHNKVRAFAGWPGTRAKVAIISKNNTNTLDVKIISTRFHNSYVTEDDENEITFAGDALLFPCAGQSALEVLEIQLPGKKAMSARDFWNGLRGQKLRKLPEERPSLQQVYSATR